MPVKKNWTPEQGHDKPAFLASLQEYPDSEEEILSTWEARSSKWEALNKGKGGRQMNCESQTSIDFKTIDADSF
jgi:hypothetical protein